MIWVVLYFSQQFSELEAPKIQAWGRVDLKFISFIRNSRSDALLIFPQVTRFLKVNDAKSFTQVSHIVPHKLNMKESIWTKTLSNLSATFAKINITSCFQLFSRNTSIIIHRIFKTYHIGLFWYLQQLLNNMSHPYTLYSIINLAQHSFGSTFFKQKKAQK